MIKEILNTQIKEALEKATSMLSNREYREEQLQMGQFLRRYLNYAQAPGHVALVEAGTGVGKSFGYLVPTYEWLQTQTDKTKIVIATNTISLQEQLTRKDLPHINSLYPQIKHAKAKGRNNYICLHRLNNPEGNLFSDGLDTDTEAKIREWLATDEGSSGDRSDINFELSQDQWKSVGAETMACFGHACPYNKDCYYNRARAKVQAADIIVTTHAMVLTDYIQGNALPVYSHLIIDEAHNFEKNAISASTVSISRRRIYWLINQSKSKFCASGFRQGKAIKKVDDWQRSLRAFAEAFFQSLPNGRVLEVQDNNDGHNLVSCIRQIISIAQTSVDKCEKAIIKTALENLCGEATALACELETWLSQSNPDTVYWGEKGEAKYVPINIGTRLSPLWATKNTILTSATLCVAKDFKAIRQALCLDEKTSYALRLESPFNYKENGLIYVPEKAPSPKSDCYTDYVLNTTIKALSKTGGKTFVLFTSYSMMKAVADKLILTMGESFTFLVQGSDSRERLLESYRSEHNAVLLGTDTFWEGIDEDIDCVILTKLPFSVPTTPVEEARCEAIKSLGKNPFIVQALPQCAIKLKQGAGRLIRHHDKRGVIIICDPRIEQNWGQTIKKTLPDMKWTRDISMMDSYLQKRAV